MDRETQFNSFFRFSSIITDLFPRFGAWFLNFLFLNLLGNGILQKVINRRAKRKIKNSQISAIKNGSLIKHRFLVVSDLNIGDAVIASSAVNALRRVFPNAKIDFVIKRAAKNFVEGNPDVSDLYPIFSGAPFPNEGDLSALAWLARNKDYDMVINFSPMIEDKIFGRQEVINFIPMAVEMIRGEREKDAINNVSYQAYKFIGEIFDDFLSDKFHDSFTGANIYLSDKTVHRASDFLLSHGIDWQKPVVMFNPDASSPFTRIPFGTQSAILKRLAEVSIETDFDFDILLGAGHVEKFIEYELVYSLPLWARQKIVVVPASTTIEVYTALMDFADVFITGDTGPLHLAAARKFSREFGNSLRNETAVISIFGGTPPRIYGYDSVTPGFFPANQDATSRAFVSGSHCRNITCINKTAKTCKEVKCFSPLDYEEIVSQVMEHLEFISASRGHRKRPRFGTGILRVSQFP
jgi:ADP-heptose:LPS heptosyltransferase